MEQFTSAYYGSCLSGHALRAFGWATHTHIICSTQPWTLVPRAWPNLGQMCGHRSTGPAIGDAGRAVGWLSLLETKSNCWHLDAVWVGSKCWIISHSHGSEKLIVKARAERKPTRFLPVLKTQKAEIPLPPKQNPQVVNQVLPLRLRSFPWLCLVVLYATRCHLLCCSLWSHPLSFSPIIMWAKRPREQHPILSWLCTQFFSFLH